MEEPEHGEFEHVSASAHRDPPAGTEIGTVVTTPPPSRRREGRDIAG
jgi:hypothetical protein